VKSNFFDIPKANLKPEQKLFWAIINLMVVTYLLEQSPKEPMLPSAAGPREGAG
jgi:hypothetical protein